LLEIAEKLAYRGARFTLIREPDAPYFGAAMSIGIHPADWKEAKRAISTLPLFGAKHALELREAEARHQVRHRDNPRDEESAA
jgi:DNA polymerase III delta subunit